MNPHTTAINILKNVLDDITHDMQVVEQQIADEVSHLEELRFKQQEICESIKHLGATDERRPDFDNHEIAAGFGSKAT